MNRIVIIFFLLYSMTAVAQTLSKDTIDCGLFKIEISIPADNLLKSQTFNYVEGFYKDYILTNNSVITLHFGTMTDETIRADSVISECNLGNVTHSISYKKNRKYFRIDTYYQFPITVSYNFVNEVNLTLAESILNNIKILKLRAEAKRKL